MQLEEVAFVRHFEDQLLDVVWLVRVRRNQRVERSLLALAIVLARPFRHARVVVGRQKVEQAPHLQQAFQIVSIRAVGDARFRRVDNGAAELFRRHHFVGYGFHDVGPGYEHVARVPHHEDEIGHCR